MFKLLSWFKYGSDHVEEMKVFRFKRENQNFYQLNIVLKSGGCTFSNCNLALFRTTTDIIPISDISTEIVERATMGELLFRSMSYEKRVNYFSITYDGKTRSYTVPWENAIFMADWYANTNK